MAVPDFRCPVCNIESGLVISEEQAICTNEDSCTVIFFNPSLPGGGTSVQILNFDSTEQPSFTCPRCSMKSYNPNDILWRYCGNCKDYTGTG